MEERDTGLGYCSNCKSFDRSVKIHDVSASPPGFHASMEGLFLDDEIEFKEYKGGWKGITIVPKAFAACKFEYANKDMMGPQVCTERKLEMCPFHVYGFNWGSETYHLIDCACLHDEFNNIKELKEHTEEIAPCVRDDEFYDFSNVQYNSVVPIIVKETPSSTVVQQKIPAVMIIPIILRASTFIHVLTYNVDKYFLGVLQTLAVKGVDVIIALNPASLTKGKLKTILNVLSYSRGNLKVIVNNKIHAKRIFIDGVYDLDLASINLSYQALYDNIENIPELNFALPSLSQKNWERIRNIHTQKFLFSFRNGQDLSDWCASKKPDVYKAHSEAVDRRKEEMKLIENARKS